MVVTAELQTAVSADTQYQYDGIYRSATAATYLRVAIPERFQRFRPPTRQRIEHWVEAGLVSPDGDTWHPGRLLLNFPDLVTCQAVGLMRDANLPMAKIRRAVAFLSYGGTRRWPFAYRDIWYSGFDIVERVDPDFVLSAIRPGQLGWAIALDGMASLRDRLRWADNSGKALWWEPRDGIRLDPEIQFGKPCVAGTRIPTGAIWGLRAAGETAESVADEYEIAVADVERAYEWECEVRAVLDAATRVPHRRESESVGS